MKWRNPQIEQLIVTILSIKGPLKGEDLLNELQGRLGRSISRASVYRYLRDLASRGIVERGADGWRINRRGLYRQKRINELNEFLEGAALFGCDFADVHVSPRVSYYAATRLEKASMEKAKELITEFYLAEAVEFIRSRMAGGEFLKRFEEFLRNVGLIVWTGFRLSAEPVGTANLWELIMLVRKGELGEDALTRYCYYGLKKLFIRDAEILAFLKILHDVGFFGALLIMLIGQDRETLARARQIFSKIPNDDDDSPNGSKENEVDEDFFRSLLEWLMAREAVVIIPISLKFYASETEAEKMNEFEKWLATLREGRLDHRLWIFTKGKQLLETLIARLERLDPEALGAPIEFLEARYPVLAELLDDQVDIDEIWTLRDLIAYYPRGRDIAFYQELLGEIERRLKANPDLRRKLESLTAGNVDSPRDF
jgi:hypothetical protein